MSPTETTFTQFRRRVRSFDRRSGSASCQLFSHAEIQLDTVQRVPRRFTTEKNRLYNAHTATAGVEFLCSLATSLAGDPRAQGISQLMMPRNLIPSKTVALHDIRVLEERSRTRYRRFATGRVSKDTSESPRFVRCHTRTAPVNARDCLPTSEWLD